MGWENADWLNAGWPNADLPKADVGAEIVPNTEVELSLPNTEG